MAGALELLGLQRDAPGVLLAELRALALARCLPRIHCSPCTPQSAQVAESCLESAALVKGLGLDALARVCSAALCREDARSLARVLRAAGRS